jgi:hypothetical protein
MINKILHIFLISLFSLTIISCAKKSSDDSSKSSDDSSSSSGSSDSDMKLSDIQSNFNNKTDFIVGEKQSTNSGRNLRSPLRTSTSSETLIVKDNDSDLDYGLISDYNIQVSDVIISRSNEYAFILLDLDYNLKNSLNCTILKVTISTNEIQCLEDGLASQSSEKDRLQTNNYYTLPVFQEGANNIFTFKTGSSGDFNPKADLACDKYCIYTHDLRSGITTRLSPKNLEGERFAALGDGNIVWAGRGTGLLLTDSSGSTTVLDQNNSGGFNIDFQSGEYKSAFYGSDSSSNAFVVTRVINGSVRKTYLPSVGQPNELKIIVVKGDDGNIYGQSPYGLYSVLPYKKNILIPYDESWIEKLENLKSKCSHPCGTFFLASGGKIYYNAYVETSGKDSYELRVYNISDNQTVKVLKPNTDCTTDCYGIVDDVYRWFVSNNSVYITLKNLSTNKKELIKINDNISFSQEGDQFTTSTDLKNFDNDFSVLSISGLNTLTSKDLSPTSIISNSSGDNYSIQVKFNKKMDYEDTESKIKIIDNSTNNSIGFMPLWNQTTLHLVIDTDNGTVFDDNANPLTSGTTYKVTLSGSAKDSDGNTLGSDVVKYITP